MGADEEFLAELKKPIEPLTEEEKETIVSNWELIGNQSLGMFVMIRLFTEHSQLKPLWNFAANLETEEQIRASQQVGFHAKKVIFQFKKLINAHVVEGKDLNSLGIDKIGQAHQKMGVKPEYFRHFIESLFWSVGQLVPEITPQMATAWTKFVMSIIQKITASME